MVHKFSEGDVYLIDNGYDKHFNVIILASPGTGTEQYLVVYLSSSTAKADRTTVFQVGDEPFISKPCWVKYQSVYLTNALELNDGRIVACKGNVKPATLARIKRDLLIAKMAPRYIKETFRDWEEQRLFDQLK